MISVVDVLRRTETFLRERGVPRPRLDAELLIGHVLHLARMQVYLQHDRPMAEDELAALRPLVKRRANREPIAYITGTVGFHGIELSVGPGVLVPRPDTETLVEAALARLPDPPPPGAPERPVFVADVGTGSGAVALALATARPDLRVFATDISPDALARAKDNAAQLGLQQRVAVLRGPLLTPIPPDRRIDWVVSNPPYIPSRDIDGLQPEVSKHEPRVALDGGRDGLAVVRALLAATAARATQGIVLEIGHDQAPATAKLATEAGFVDVQTHKDLGGHGRVVSARLAADTPDP